MRNLIQNKSRIGTILSQVGYILQIISGMLISPLIALIWFPIEYKYAIYFVLPAGLFFAIGKLLVNSTKEIEINRLTRGQQINVVVIAWLIGLIGLAIPFVISGMLTISQAILEVSSGLSTTGLSVVDVKTSPNIFLMYRSMLQFFGGVGIILIVTTIFRRGARFDVYELEGHSDKLVPNFKDSAKKIFQIYIAIIVAGMFGLMIAGMDSFSALNISICSVSTGGFAMTPNSIADYHSAAVSLIVIALMILGSLSFLTLAILLKRDFKRVAKVNEVKLFIVLIVGFTAISYFAGFGDITTAALNQAADQPKFIIALFEITSAITTTGFSLIDYHHLMDVNHIFYMLLVIGMVIGGASGSTAGGIKVTRLVVILKSIAWNMKKMVMRGNKVQVRKIQTPTELHVVTDSEISIAGSYIALYIIILLIGTGIFAIFGYSFDGGLFEMASALGNVGLSIGITSPDLHPILLWTLSTAMFIGRLEIFVVLVAISNLLNKIFGK